MNAVAKNLKRLRKQTGLTQEELAEKLHVTRQAVSSWETARTQPDIETLTALAEALGTDVNELIYGPRPDGERYARYQKKYVICAAVCAVLALAWLLMEIELVPYLKRLQSTTFEARPLWAYMLFVQPLALFAAGSLLPALASLWVDIRLRGACFRRCFLAAGLALITLLLLVEVIFLVPLMGGAVPEFVVRQYMRFMGFVAYTVENQKMLAFFGGLCLFLGLNR